MIFEVEALVTGTERGEKVSIKTFFFLNLLIMCLICILPHQAPCKGNKNQLRKFPTVDISRFNSTFAHINQNPQLDILLNHVYHFVCTIVNIFFFFFLSLDGDVGSENTPLDSCSRDVS